eukprot:2791560-Rhodomonas_salina.1
MRGTCPVREAMRDKKPDARSSRTSSRPVASPAAGTKEGRRDGKAGSEFDTSRDHACELSSSRSRRTDHSGSTWADGDLMHPSGPSGTMALCARDVAVAAAVLADRGALGAQLTASDVDVSSG